MKQSAGILVFRRQKGVVEVLLMHPGGPFHAKKNMWSIPKGEAHDGEDLALTADREFEEETGLSVPAGERIDLGISKQSGKINYIWAVEGGDLDIKKFDPIRPGNMVKMEWPPHSGTMIEFPENDRAGWFDLASVAPKVFKGQVVFLERLAEHLKLDFTQDVEPVQQSLL